MPLESILEKYGFSLRHDRSGKAVIDLENMQLFRDEIEKPLKCSKVSLVIFKNFLDA